MASQQQCMDRIAQVDTRLEQFRHGIRQDAFEIALTVQRVIQDVQGQGQGMELRHTLFKAVTEKVETLDARFQKFDEFVQTVLDKTDRNTDEVCTSIGRIIEEQGDIRRMVGELARRIDNMREKTHSEGPLEPATHSEVGVAMQLELNDLKTKVHRLTEQTTDHAAQLSFFSVMSEKVDLMEKQIHRWRYRLPDLSDDENHEPAVAAVDVQEQLSQFQESTRSNVRDLRHEVNSLERKVRHIQRARSESWELISQ